MGRRNRDKKNKKRRLILVTHFVEHKPSTNEKLERKRLVPTFQSIKTYGKTYFTIIVLDKLLLR